MAFPAQGATAGTLATAAFWNANGRDNLNDLDSRVNDCARVIAGDVTEQEVVNTTTETTIFTTTITGGVMGTTKKLRLHLSGRYFNDSGASRNFTIRTKFGGTTVAGDSAIGFPDSATGRRRMRMQVDICNKNSASSQSVSAIIHSGPQDPVENSGAWGTTAPSVLIGGYIGLAISTGSNQTLSVTVEHGAASAQLSFKVDEVFVELLDAA